MIFLKFFLVACHLRYLTQPNPKKSHVSMDIFLTTLSPPSPPHLQTLWGDVFFSSSKSAYRRLRTIGKKACRLPFFGEILLLRGNYNFWCKSDDFLGVNSDLLCYFHPIIASVKLVKNTPKSYGMRLSPPLRKVSIET